MIILITDSKTANDEWAPEELWLDYLTGYLCRRAVFSKNSENHLSLISSQRIDQLVLLAPTTFSKDKIRDALSLNRDQFFYCTDNTKEVLFKIFGNSLSGENFRSLKSYLGEFTTQDLIAYL